MTKEYSCADEVMLARKEVKGKEVPLTTPQPQAHGTLKRDVYWTGDNKSQEITTVETPAVDIAGAKVSAAIGKDRCTDTPPSQERDVFDVFIKKPIAGIFSFVGRVRSSFGQHNPTSQVRAGLNASIPVTDKTSLYSQVYAADKATRDGWTKPSFGAFGGLSHKISDRTSFYVEGQVYQGRHIDRGSVGVNAGLKVSF